MPQNYVTKYFRKAKEHIVQWQLNTSYHLTFTPVIVIEAAIFPYSKSASKRLLNYVSRNYVCIIYIQCQYTQQ